MTRTTKLLILLAVLITVAAIVYAIGSFLPDWFWHPLGYCTGTHVAIRDCKGYNLWSGTGSDVSELQTPFALTVVVLGFWRVHNCHVKRCWRLRWHVHPEHGHPVCQKHFKEDGTSHGLT